jgi:hypothetical protein
MAKKDIEDTGLSYHDLKHSAMDLPKTKLFSHFTFRFQSCT